MQIISSVSCDGVHGIPLNHKRKTLFCSFQSVNWAEMANMNTPPVFTVHGFGYNGILSVSVFPRSGALNSWVTTQN